MCKVCLKFYDYFFEAADSRLLANKTVSETL